jgi:hypothetical protein
MIAYDIAFVSGRMIEELGYRSNIFEVKYRRIVRKQVQVQGLLRLG